MFEIDTSTPVLVTGATGFVAGWVVKRLLESGATVHAAVRDPANTGKLRYLDALAETSAGTIRYFKADLLTEGSYAAAMDGASVVFHTASPFKLSVKDPQKELIDPALNGTRNVLQEAARIDSVKRVVVTSSVAAIYTDAAECAEAPNGILTEDVWNTTASLDYQPYSYSKTLAERAAWTIAEAQSSWDLVTVNPSLVLGPAIGGRPTSESFAIMRSVGEGDFRHGAPRIAMGFVDVRDVARAHLAAAYTPGARGRHIVSGQNGDMFHAVHLLQPRFGRDYPIPARAIPKWLIWLVAPAVGLTRRSVAGNVDVPITLDNSKSLEELGLTYRPLTETMEDMFQYMIHEGYFPAARA
jgi:nucleoside-diphosphate-sugar epimerase